MSTLDTIKDILKEKQGIDPSEVNDDSTFESLNLDSLDMVEMICELEDRLEIDFGDPEGLNCVGDVVEYVENLQK